MCMLVHVMLYMFHVCIYIGVCIKLPHSLSSYVLLYSNTQCEHITYTRSCNVQQQPPQTHMHTTSVTMLDTFFSLSWARFGQGWRPDVPPYSIFDDNDQDQDDNINAAKTTATGTGSDGSIWNSGIDNNKAVNNNTSVTDDPLRVDIDEVSNDLYTYLHRYTLL
jgi:hypothetical protein